MMNSMGQMLAGMGRYGDDSVAHVDTGEVVVPKSAITPGLMHQIMMAMDSAGLDANRYIVGSGRKHPETGMQEFWGGAGDDGTDSGTGDDTSGPGGGDQGAGDFGGGDFGGGDFGPGNSYGGGIGSFSGELGANAGLSMADPGTIGSDPSFGVSDTYGGGGMSAPGTGGYTGEDQTLGSTSYYGGLGTMTYNRAMELGIPVAEYPGMPGYGFNHITNPDVTISQGRGSLSDLGPFGGMLGVVGLLGRVGESIITGTYPGLGFDKVAGLPGLAAELGISVPNTDVNLGFSGIGGGLTGTITGDVSNSGYAGLDGDASWEDADVDSNRHNPPAPPKPTVPDPVEVPDYLTFPAGMTDLQRRAYIANQGVSGDDGRFRTPEAQRYLRYLTLAGAGDDSGVLPIEAQYYRDVSSLLAEEGMSGIYNLIQNLSI